MKTKIRNINGFTIIDLISDSKETIPQNSYETFEIELKKSQGTVIRILEDEIGKGNVKIALNILKAEYIHSGGIGVFSRMLKTVWDAGGQLYIITDNPSIQYTIETVGLNDSLPVYKNEEEFIEAEMENKS